MVAAGFAMRVGLRNGLRDRAHASLEAPFHVVEARLVAQPESRLADLLDRGPPDGDQGNELIGQVLDAGGTVIDTTGEPTAATAMVGSAELAAATRDGHWHEPRHLAGRAAEDIVVVEPIRSGSRAGDYVVMAQTLQPTDDEVDRLTRLFLMLTPVVLATSFLGGYWIARTSLRPVDVLTRQAAVIDPGLSDTTLPVPAGDDEVSRLAQSLNDMLGRLRQEIDRQRRFSADASHELRTPLALMTTNLDVSLRSPTVPESARPILESIREDAARLNRIVDDLLFLSRAEATGHVELAASEVDLLDLVVSAASRFKSAAEARGVVIEVTGTPVVATVDGHLLSQALGNLVDNAVKFSGSGSRVVIDVARVGGACIAVTDEGPGIPAADLEKVFERFYQVDSARRTGGSGLGLAIVRSIVRAHGGSVEVESDEGHGTCFTIRLPAELLASEG